MANRDAFTQACIDAFAFLVGRFGFDEPEVESIGRETYVRYHRKNQTVSIAWEAGMAPIVELFYPPLTPSEQPVPWAERGGVARCRRIPRLRALGKLDAKDEASMSRYLRDEAAALEQVEHEWLVA